MSLRTILLAGSLATAGLITGCHHDPAPVAPVVDPSEPRTPIGYLLTNADLKLNPDQLSGLRGIDDDLAIKLAAIDPQLDAALKAQAEKDKKAKAGDLQPGEPGLATKTNAAGYGSKHDPRKPKGPQPPPPSPHKSDKIDQLIAQRATTVRDSIQRALTMLDPGQQQLARATLSEHDVDIETDTDAGGNAPPASGSADAPPPETAPPPMIAPPPQP